MNHEQSRALILGYWKSWQGEPDWGVMRRALADRIDFGGHAMESAQFIEMCKQGSQWQGVELLGSLFADDAGALMYEGTDTKSGKRIRVAEIIRIENGKIVSLQGCFGSGQPPA